MVPIFLIGAGLLMGVYSMNKISRGIRNNNPGNIRHSKENWKGQSVDQTDKEFVQFKSAEYGIRALYRVLLTYARKYNLNTIHGIISRWAPPEENDTDSYIKSVSKHMQFDPHEKIPLTKYVSLIEAIIKHENGQQPYTHEQILRGVALS